MNRRNILAGVAALPAAIAMTAPGANAAIAMTAPGANAATAAPTRVSPELIALIAEARFAEETVQRHHENVYTPAAAATEKAIAAIPHVTLDGGPNMVGGRVIYTTSDRSVMASAGAIVAMAKEGKPLNSTAVSAARKIVAAGLWRTRAAARIRKATGLPQIIEDSNALADRAATTQNLIAAYPVGTAADLVAKLAFMIEREMGDTEWFEELHADARRLAKMEG